MIVLLILIIVLLMAVLLHESIHFLVALALDYHPKIKWSVFYPAVYYENKQNHYHNILIACSAPLSMIAIGLLIKGNDTVTTGLKCFCLANIFNLLPVTNDGEVILLSLCRMIRRK